MPWTMLKIQMAIWLLSRVATEEWMKYLLDNYNKDFEITSVFLMKQEIHIGEVIACKWFSYISIWGSLYYWYYKNSQFLPGPENLAKGVDGALTDKEWDQYRILVR